MRAIVTAAVLLALAACDLKPQPQAVIPCGYGSDVRGGVCVPRGN